VPSLPASEVKPIDVTAGSHRAKRVVFAAIDHVEEPPAVNVVPDPSAAVFQPANVYPVRTNDPLLADAVNEASYVALPLDGATPPEFEFPLYVTVYVFAVH